MPAANLAVAPAGLAVGEIQAMPEALRRREAANSPGLVLNAARFVTIQLAAQITGLTVRGIESKIARAVWLEGKHFRRADGRIFIDMKEYEKWVEKAAA